MRIKSIVLAVFFFLGSLTSAAEEFVCESTPVAAPSCAHPADSGMIKMIVIYACRLGEEL